MKKITSVIICIAMLFALCACSSQTAQSKSMTPQKIYSDSIPLGGNAGEYDVTGAAFGDYVATEPYGDFLYDEDFDENVLYVDENCDTPYILVTRFDAEDYSLEDIAKEEADLYSNGFYQIIKDEFCNVKECAYYVSSDYAEGKFYYSQNVILQDGDDFVEISFYCASEEVQLGTTDKFIYIPAGGQSMLSDDDISHGYFCGVDYDESYYFPSIYAGEFDPSYEYAQWYWNWSGEHSGELPFTEEQYRQWYGTSFDDSQYDNVYESLGYKVDYEYKGEKEGCPVTFAALSYGNHADVNAAIMVGDKMFDIWTTTYNLTWPAYLGHAMLNSLHTVEGAGTADKENENTIAFFDLEPIDVSGPAFGKYEVIDTPEAFLSGDDEVNVYYSKSSDTPYIITYKWTEADSTIEQEAEKWIMGDDSLFYTIGESDAKRCAYMCYSAEGSTWGLDEGLYYIECNIIECGDDYCAVEFFNASEELLIGNTGKAFYIPKGYDVYVENEEDLANGEIFYGAYDDSYYMPTIYLGTVDDAYYSYDQLGWYWSVDQDKLPVDEKTYNSWVESSWDEASDKAYLEAFKYDVQGNKTETFDGVDIDYMWGTYESLVDGQTVYEVDSYFVVDGQMYNFFLDTTYVPTPTYANAIFASMHDAKILPVWDLAPVNISGSAYGNYELIETPDEITSAMPDIECNIYKDLNCDKPYIIISRWKNEAGKTLEQSAETGMKDLEATFYQTFEYKGNKCAYLCYSTDGSIYGLEEGFYYADSVLTLNGDYFYSIDTLSKTEEIKLGQSGKSVYIPTGGTATEPTDEDKAHGFIFETSYDDSYYMPYIYIGAVPSDYPYEDLCWYWGLDEKDMPLDEKTYSEMTESGWTEEENAAYYKAFGIDITGSLTQKVDDLDVEFYFGTGNEIYSEDECHVVDAYVQIGDTLYNIWIETGFNPAPAYANAIFASIH